MQSGNSNNKKIKKGKRQIKIYPKYVIRSGKIISEIRLTGRWIEELGFTAGNRIIIFCEENKIIIIPAEIAIQNHKPDEKTG